MTRAVIYARFSCSKQREASITDQLRVCREYCESQGWEVVNEYTDSAISGRTDNRPAFQQMIASAGEAERVVVYMLDRFSRDRYDSIVYKKALKDKGVSVVSATEPMPQDEAAMLIESVYEALAAMESAHTSKRVKRGMEGNALNCHFNGVYLYGYTVDENGHYVVDDYQASVVREIFERRVQGESVTSIASDLEARKVRDKPVTYGWVYNILHNEKYTGVYIWGDTRIEGGVPQIVSKDVFKAAQEAKSRKQPRNEKWRSYPLSGKALCSCGSALSGASGSGNGGRYDYYRCKACGKTRVRADKLEGDIVEAIRRILSDDVEARRIAEIIASRGKDKAAEKAAQKRLEAAEKGIDNLVRAVSQGIPADRAAIQIEELEEVARAARAELKRCALLSLDVATFIRFLQFGATLTDEKLLEAFVYQVWVFENETIVTLNYNKDDEPARFSLPVREKIEWWTNPKDRQTQLAVYQGYVLIRIA